MELPNQRVLVVGAGRSGLAAARLAALRGARVTITDHKPADMIPGLGDLPATVARECGGHRVETFLGADLIVLSPGVPELPELVAARAAGIAVTGELEMAARRVGAALVAVTGTNGKSTTTALAGFMLGQAGRPLFVGGNLGQPLSSAVGTPAAGAAGLCVVEVSSFQLETAVQFHPRVAVLLNVSADHLDRYLGMAAYAAAKARIFAAQTSTDAAVFNADDPIVADLTRDVRAQRISFSTTRTLGQGVWLDGADIVYRVDGDAERYPAHSPGLVGRHNQENACASIAAARLCGATPDEVAAGLASYRPLPHRMELVAEDGDIAFYDDSKGTNVGATVAALARFPRPVVLIAGGRDKGGDYAPLARVLARSGRAAVLIGEARPRLRAALGGHLAVEEAEDMDDAVRRALALARPGDAVVLSPACSSFDMFRDYQHRAAVFRAAVAAMIAGRSGEGASR